MRSALFIIVYVGQIDSENEADVISPQYIMATHSSAQLETLCCHSSGAHTHF